jgi:hypothetical protein
MLKGLGRGFVLLGTVVLGACGTLSSEKKGMAASERVALGKDLRAAMNTFVPSGEFNPTSYLTLTGIRGPDGNVILAPFLGHWQADASGKRAFHLAVAGNSDDPKATAFFGGIRSAFADGRGVVGVGTTLVNETFTQALAAKWKLDEKTIFTFSTNPDVLRESIFNVQRNLGAIKGTVLTSYLEKGVDQFEQFRVGASLERGQHAVDIAFDNTNNRADVRWNFGFGKSGEHFLFAGPTYDVNTREWSWQAGVNFTSYLFGRSKRSPRRKVQRTREKLLRERVLAAQRSTMRQSKASPRSVRAFRGRR